MDISQSVWTESDSGNSTPAPDGAPEGMFPSGINDTIRADRGAIKRWYNQTIPLLTGGTSTAYTLTYGVAPTALADGMTHLVQWNATNGLAPTLNVNLLGAMPLHYYAAGSWRAIPTGLLGADQVFRVIYNASAGAYRILRPRDDTGEVVPFAGTTAPAGTLLCSGQAISRTDYVGLFTALSTTYGVGDGLTTFNLPDLTGRVVAGKEATATRLTAGVSGVDGGTLGAIGGDQRLQTHSHQFQAIINVGAANGGSSVTGNWNNAAGQSTTNAGSGASQNVQPTIILNYIIKT